MIIWKNYHFRYIWTKFGVKMGTKYAGSVKNVTFVEGFRKSTSKAFHIFLEEIVVIHVKKLRF